MAYQVNEIFRSIQGEGYWIGTPAVFIRLQGCPVGCDWCDTKYTWGKGGRKMDVMDIIQEAKIERGAFVVITGGEPLMYDLDELLQTLRSMACYTQIETSGINWYKGNHAADWLTWSPKPKLEFKAHNLIIRYCREVKIVVDANMTAEIAKRLWEQAVHSHGRSYAPPPYLMLMPEGAPPTAESMKHTLEIAHELNWINRRPGRNGVVRVCDRLQFRLGVK